MAEEEYILVNLFDGGSTGGVQESDRILPVPKQQARFLSPGDHDELSSHSEDSHQAEVHEEVPAEETLEATTEPITCLDDEMNQAHTFTISLLDSVGAQNSGSRCAIEDQGLGCKRTFEERCFIK